MIGRFQWLRRCESSQGLRRIKNATGNPRGRSPLVHWRQKPDATGKVTGRRPRRPMLRGPAAPPRPPGPSTCVHCRWNETWASKRIRSKTTIARGGPRSGPRRLRGVGPVAREYASCHGSPLRVGPGPAAARWQPPRMKRRPRFRDGARGRRRRGPLRGPPGIRQPH
jgi:hypothetical protein